MPLSLALPTPLEYFASLVQSDAEFPLFEAAVSLAQDEYPDLDVQQVLGEVVPDLTAPCDDDVHGYEVPPRGASSSSLARITESRIMAEMVVVGQTVVRPNRR